MKVIIQLKGGLGNQMFQYAFTKYISEKTGRKIVIDLSFLNRRDFGPNFAYRNYDLDMFNIEGEVVEQFDEPYELIQENWDVLHSVQYDLIVKAINSTSENIYLDGYFPSPIYFNNTIDFFNKFKYNIEENSIELMNEIINSNSVMINIRRTDFVNNDFHGTYGRDYVLKALSHLENKNDYKFFIFSDDIQWCQENLSDLGTIVTHEHKGHKFSTYLQLMSLCKVFILPNSSFAWWSAYLSDSKTKVFYPEKFINVPPYTFEGMYPSDWVKLI
jgi:hypothetical protein